MSLFVDGLDRDEVSAVRLTVASGSVIVERLVVVSKSRTHRPVARALTNHSLEVRRTRHIVYNIAY